MEFGLFPIPDVGEAIVGVTTGYRSSRHAHDGYSVGIFDQAAEIWCRGKLHRIDQGMLVALEPGEAHGGRGTARNIRQHGLIILPEFMAAQFGNERPFTFPWPIISDPKLGAKLSSAIQSRDSGEVRSCLDRLFTCHALGRLSLPGGDNHRVIVDQRLNRFQRYRRCRAATGLSPSDLKRMDRVEAARRLIGSGLPLAEVALIAGFADQAHMTRQLRALWGVTPGTLRRSAAR